MDYTELLKKISKSQIDPELLDRINNLGKNHRDALTGLLDYRSFSWQMEERVANRGPYALIAISIDFLQELNLISGWIVGDLALCSLASCIENLPQSNGLNARISGATFMIYTQETDITQLKQWIEQIATQLGEMEFPGVEMFPEGHLTISTGIYCCTVLPPKTKVEQAMNEAKSRLKLAERQGGNRVIVLSETQSILHEHDTRNITTKIREQGTKGWLNATLWELSLNGASIHSEIPILVRKIIELKLKEPDHEDLSLTGEIVWRKPISNDDTKKFSLGIRFTNLSEEQLGLLEHIMTGSNQ